MTVVADTGAVLGLVDAGDRHHRELLDAFDAADGSWILPWAVLPEIDYLLLTHLGVAAEAAWLDDVASGAFHVERGRDGDLARARAICDRYSALKLGLVDAVVIATAERLKANAIVTLDLRAFAAVDIAGAPALWPRDRVRSGKRRRP